MARLAAVLVAMLLALTACGHGSSPSASTRNADDPLSFRCPDPVSKVGPTPGPSLPAGARAARICVWGSSVPWHAPLEPLTRDVDRLVALVNGQEPYPKSDGCFADDGPAYRIVVDYPDGARLIEGDTAGCREVEFGASELTGGPAVWRTYFRLLARQRQHARPGRVAVARPSCPTRQQPGAFTPLWDARMITAARFCPPRTAQHPQVPAGSAFSARDLRRLRHDMLTSSDRRQQRPVIPSSCHGLLQHGYDVVAVDRWGDHIDMRGYCDVYPMVIPGTSRSAYVRELPATRAMLERLARS
jgi:hypothetical protein